MAMATNGGFQGVSKCYVFKSRLQEYAQKVGLPTPVYETVKEGPSHEPTFRSTVIVNDIRYNSLCGFSNRKVAEQSAAEVALMELAKSSEAIESIRQPVHQTGLCKNLLQEYAQKMNYAIPLYRCQRDEAPGHESLFTCTLEIGGISYIGAAAKTKKEAEIKAARTALLAIESSSSEFVNRPASDSNLTVIPCKKRGAEAIAKPDDTANMPKLKKAAIRKKLSKKKPSRNNNFHPKAENGVNLLISAKEESKLGIASQASGFHSLIAGMPAPQITNHSSDNVSSNGSLIEMKGLSTVENALPSSHHGSPNGSSIEIRGLSTVENARPSSNHGSPNDSSIEIKGLCAVENALPSGNHGSSIGCSTEIKDLSAAENALASSDHDSPNGSSIEIKGLSAVENALPSGNHHDPNEQSNALDSNLENQGAAHFMASSSIIEAGISCIERDMVASEGGDSALVVNKSSMDLSEPASVGACVNQAEDTSRMEEMVQAGAVHV